MAALRHLDGRERPHPGHQHRAAGLHERVPAGRGHLSLLTVSLQHARRLALHAQGLAAAPPRGGAGPDAVAAVTERIGCLQLDPVSAVARSPLLVLFARLGSTVRETALERAAYERRMLFDAWAHEASLVATADLPLHRWAMRTYLDAPTTRAARAREFLTANAAFCDELVAELRDRGPLRARELEDRSAEPWRHGWWTDEVSGRQTIARLLHLLWITGRVGVGRREAGERLWDVFERCLPAGAPTTTLDDDAAERAAVLRALRMLGVARPAHVRAHFLRRRYPRLPQTLAALTAAGTVERVKVEGLRGEWYAAAGDLERLADLAPGARTAVLSPFDNLLCDRARAAELFGFDHRLEIYVPAAQRRWGYYVLPILHRERLVARADAVLDRDAGLLRVNALYHEPDVRPTPALERAIARALERLAAWRGASGVHVARRSLSTA